MSTVISSLYVELALQADNFNNGIKTALKSADEFNKTIKPSITAAKELGEAMTVAGGAVIAGLTLMVKQAADYGDSMRDASIRTGVTVQSMAGLKMAAEQTGTSFDDLQTGLKKLAVNADAATVSGSSQAKMFESMGVTVRDVNTGAMRPINDILMDVSEHFKTMGDKTKETGELVAAFGKGGASFTEFMELGISGMTGYQERAQKLGLVLGSDFPANADNFKDSLNDMHDAELGASIVIGNVFIPALTDAAIFLSNTIVKVREFIDAHRDIVVAVGVVGGALVTFGGLLVTFATVAGTATKAMALLNVAMDANPIGATVAAIVALTAAVIYYRDTLEAGVIGLVSVFVAALGALAQGAGTLATAFGATGMGATLTSAGDSILAVREKLLSLRASFLDSTDSVTLSQAAIDAYKKSHQVLPPAIDDAAAAAKRFKDAVDALTNSVVPSNEKARELAAAITQLTNAGIPAATIVADLGKKAEEMELQYAAAGLTIPASIKPIIDQIYLQYEAQKASTQGQKDLIDQQNANLKDASELRTELAITDVDTAAAMLRTLASLDNDYANGKTAEAMTTSQFLMTLPKAEMDNQVAINKLILDEEGKKADAMAALAKQVSGEWTKQMNSMAQGIAGSFADMIVNWQFSTDALINVAKNTAKSMLTAFLDGLIKPLTNELAKLGTSITDTILGITPPAAPQAAPATGAPIAVSVPSAPSGNVGNNSDNNTARNIEIASAAGAGAIATDKGIRSMAHFEANDLVKNFQAPFDTSFANIIAAETNALNSGTLALPDAKAADDELHAMWAASSNAVNSWASAKPGDRTTVAAQFHQTEDNFVNNWLNWADSLVASLGGIPSYDVGIKRVPFDQIAMVHAGERITPAAQVAREESSGMGGGGFSLQIGELHVHGAPDDDKATWTNNMLNVVLDAIRTNRGGFREKMQRLASARV